MQEYDKLYKILIVGNSGVGKSSILLRFCDECFMESFISTIGVDFKIRTINIDDKIYKLQIWDTAGQERFRTITSSYYRGAHGILLVYDVTDRHTFNTLSTWCEEINKYINNIGIIIIGNKIDIKEKRDVGYDEAHQYAQNHDYGYIETSAKNDTNIGNAFIELVKKMNSNIKSNEKESIPIVIAQKNMCCNY